MVSFVQHNDLTFVCDEKWSQQIVNICCQTQLPFIPLWLELLNLHFKSSSPTIIVKSCCILVRCFSCIYWDDLMLTLVLVSFGSTRSYSRNCEVAKFYKHLLYKWQRKTNSSLWIFCIKVITGDTTKLFFAPIIAL